MVQDNQRIGYYSKSMRVIKKIDSSKEKRISSITWYGDILITDLFFSLKTLLFVGYSKGTIDFYEISNMQPISNAVEPNPEILKRKLNSGVVSMHWGNDVLLYCARDNGYGTLHSGSINFFFAKLKRLTQMISSIYPTLN